MEIPEYAKNTFSQVYDGLVLKRDRKMEKLGRFRVVSELGRGGGGVVYLATDPDLERRVAVKTIPLHGAFDSEDGATLKERLLREARAAGLLNHPNIVTVYELGQEGDLHYIAMEYVPGKALRDMIRSGEKLKPAMVISYLRQIAAALDFAHGREVVHRDVKPANVLVTDDGVAKITDFGVAKILSQAGAGLTRTGTTVGTAYYMPPEQIMGAAVDGRSDQFSLAVIAYEMLAGRRPFDADNPTGILYQITHENPTALSETAPDIPKACDGVLNRSLAKKKEDRYADCLAFVDELGRALGVTAPATATTATPIPARPPEPGRKGRLAVMLGAVAVIAAGVSWMTTRSGAPEPPPTPVAAPQEAAVVKPPEPAPQPPRSEPERKATSKSSVRPVEIPKASQQPPPEPEPTKPAPPAAPVIPQAPPVEAGKYRGPPVGRFTWSGSLLPDGVLALAARWSSAGSITGMGLPPSTQVSVEVTPADVRILEQPMPGNRFRLLFRNTTSREVNQLTIQWKEVSP